MFEESKVNLMLGTPNVEQALEGPLSAFSDALAGLNHALKHDSFDPRTNESYPFGAQYEAYERMAEMLQRRQAAKAGRAAAKEGVSDEVIVAAPMAIRLSSGSEAEPEI